MEFTVYLLLLVATAAMMIFGLIIFVSAFKKFVIGSYKLAEYLLDKITFPAFWLGRFSANAVKAFIVTSTRYFATTDKQAAPKAEPTANQQAPAQDSLEAVAAERQRQAEYDFENIPAYIRQGKGIIIW